MNDLLVAVIAVIALAAFVAGALAGLGVVYWAASRGGVGLPWALPLLVLAAAPALAHGPYSGLRSPSGVSCCDDRDCFPVAMCATPSGGEGFEIQGRCWPVPHDKAVPSPDGGAHACYRWQGEGADRRPAFICAMLPAGA